MSGVEGSLRGSVRDELEAIGFTPIASTLYRPSPGPVSRSALVGEVRAAGADVVAVTAPAGYGKSTFVAELAAGDPRPTAWVPLSPTENDPAGLLSSVALALDDVEPVDARCVSALWIRRPTIGSPSLEQFRAMVAGRSRAFMLVLDDVHELVDDDVIATLTVLIGDLPAGSTVVLASRIAIPLPFGRLRARRRLVEVGPAELAFSEPETAVLLAELGINPDPIETATLVARTEGWPVALYLAALAHGTRGGPMSQLVADFTGDHRYLVDYLGEELLGDADPELVSFLMEASCFDRMSGSLCDDVLHRHGSAQLLEAVRRRNLLVIPLDDHREWYRFHHLMSEFLQSELRHRDPAGRVAIHLRASEWHHAHEDADDAVRHAVLGGDMDRAEALVRHSFGTLASSGRYPTIDRWMTMFSADQLAARPYLMVAAGFGRFLLGEPGSALQWLRRAAAALPDPRPADAQGPVAPTVLALVRAIIEPIDPVEMAAEARYAYDHIGPAEGHPLACLALGAAAFMVGDEAEAVRRLREGAETTLGRQMVEAVCRAHLTVIDVEHGRWSDAATGARRARSLLGTTAELPASTLVLAMGVLVETHAGHADDVEADRQRCRQHLTRLIGVAPSLNLQARIALARAANLRGDRAEATALAHEADALLATIPNAVHVAEQLATLRQQLATRDRSQSFGPSSLTTAELRVLQLLPTHLSVGEIADRLFVSRNTVKSQTIAIYRKLGTSSRGGAVELAAAAGLLPGGGRRESA